MSQAPAISEAASEKRKRGRPQKLSDFEVTFARETAGPNVRTARGVANVAHRITALMLVRKVEALKWLGDPDAMLAAAPGSWRPEILTELGRCAEALGDDRAIELAHELTAERARRADCAPMRAKDCIAWLRSRRIGAPMANAPELGRMLAQAACDYFNRHARPDDKATFLRGALQNAAELLGLEDEE